MQSKGRFIIIDGITGSGKSTVLQAVHEWALSCGHKIFKQIEWEKTEPPTFEEIQDVDVYFTYEPTRRWVGSAIRYELSRTDMPYGGEALAHAFALDRQIQYRRLILPALNAGKTIIQDRGVSSSIVYQPVMPNSVPLETVMRLPGNRLALAHAPHALIITQLPAQNALKRIHARDGEHKGVFADLAFMRKQEERFRAAWFREIFESRGTKIFELDTSGDRQESQQRTIHLIEQIFQTC